MYSIGIDTSNYTTSAALFDSAAGVMYSKKRLLPVKEGELGLRQSDALFHHTVALPEILEESLSSCNNSFEIAAVGVSDKPRDAEGSYMPCFLAGVNVASCAAKLMNVPLYTFSHQAGHIAAAIYSSGRQELLSRECLAFHVSGGTTEVVQTKPDSEKIIAAKTVLTSLDLKAGQAVDRTGVMLGFPFPAGKLVDAKAQESDRTFKIKVPMRDGCCSLSGLQNKCEKMKKDGESDSDICRFCIEYIAEALSAMAKYALSEYGELPLIFSGGVMSNSIIRSRFMKEFDCTFAQPEYSCDNAAGIAYLASIKKEGIF
ncbi:MAG: peptidase M22 [Clostridia bacterium]|nr:peptidase M22 [Clostridia bacterium]